MGKIKTTAELALEAGSTLDIDSSTALQINSSGGAISIGNDNVSQAINIGTSGTRTLTLGSTNSTSSTTVQSGSGVLNVTSTNGALTINSGTGALGISTDASVTTVSFATGGAVKTVSLGSTNTTSTTTVQSGSGGISLATSTNGAIALTSGTGAINIGTDANAKTITIGTTIGATAIAINTGTGDFTVTSASGTLISQLDTGEMTRPLQPAFLAYLAGDTGAVTGAGSSYTLGTAALTEVFDQGGNFNTNGTFTAPVTGRYSLTAQALFEGVTSAMTQGVIRIVTSNRTYFNRVNAANLRANDNTYSQLISALADMDSGDTATVQVLLINGAGDTANIGGSATILTYFCGNLVC